MTVQTNTQSGMSDQEKEKETGRTDSFSAVPNASVSDLKKKAEDLGVGYREEINIKGIDKNILSIIPEETIRKFRMVTVSREKETGIIEVVMENPEDVNALNALRFLAKEKGVKFSISLGSPALIDGALSRYESAEKALKDVVDVLTIDEESDREKDEEMGNDSEATMIIKNAPVAKLVEVIIRHAIEGKASDIHIEPSEAEYRIRYRVDGVLYSSLTIPKNVGKTVVARVKILADLKIDEKRKPQDGRFYLEFSKNRIDFRVSTFPVVEGEKVVLRVLDKETGLGDLKDLGLFGKNYEIFTKRIHDPYGIILITGPTGSGKSTTLYGFLKLLNIEGTNIVTLEDPVEYFIQGINQSQIRPDIGYTFANGLRSILRQDPNVIMVGEIRDSETAELSIHAALTGHLVFTTLHTNDAIGAIPRLLDMGVESFLLSASLRVVAAQRLVRKICTHCKKKAVLTPRQEKKIYAILSEVDPIEIQKYGITEEMIKDGIVMYEGSGCDECGNTGYKGRIAIYEALEIDSKLQEILNEDAGHAEGRLISAIREQKLVTMKQDGILKALLGITTLAEIGRVTDGSRSDGGDREDDKG
jgi:type IV pilus assembly protein PilB